MWRGYDRASGGAGLSNLESATNLGVALAIGLLIGLERERRKGDGPERSAAGIRTFALTGLMGGLATAVGEPWAVPAALVVIGAVAAVSYVRSPRTDPGITTEVALVTTFLLGVLAYREPALAAAAGVATAALLTFRSSIHRFASKTLTEEELHDILLFAAAAVVVLPLLPDRTVGPFDVLNPFSVWRLVVVVMGMSGVGYVGLRLLGPRLGLPLAGLAGGFVSSAATIGSMGNTARREPALAGPAVAGAVLSTVATIAQMAIVLALADEHTLARVAAPLGAAGVAAVLYGVVSISGIRQQATGEQPTPARAFQLRAAVVFATMVTGILFLAAALERWLGETGAVVSASVAGFADAHAAASSVATLAANGDISAHSAAFGVLAAITTNSLTKAVLATTSGRGAFMLRVWLGLALVLAAAWAAFAAERFLPL
jgi:uncharacterized membrane protein (DUF4010 family)